MGTAVSAAREQAEANDKAIKERIQSQLEFLVNAANSKLDKYQNEMEDMFTDPGTVDKKMIPGIRAMRWDRGYRVGVTKETVGGGLTEIVDNFFGVVKDATDEDMSGKQKNTSIINGFKNIVNNSLSTILGNSNAGEQEEKKFFIFMEHNAVIRIDVKIWKYNFASKGVMADTENVFCYIFCTSVVNSQKVKLDELTYLLSEYAGDDDVVAYVDKILTIWTSVHKMHRFLLEQSALTRSIEKSTESGERYDLALPAPESEYSDEEPRKPVRRAIAARFVDRDMYVRYAGGGVGHYSIKIEDTLQETSMVQDSEPEAAASDVQEESGNHVGPAGGLGDDEEAESSGEETEGLGEGDSEADKNIEDLDADAEGEFIAPDNDEDYE